jgi:hypothetical protein
MSFAVLGRNSLIQLLAKYVLFPFIPLRCRMTLVGVADKVVIYYVALSPLYFYAIYYF